MNDRNDENRRDQLTTVLKYQGAVAAEGHLTEIAHTEGDEAVMRVAQHMSATEVAQVTSEADVVKPSLLHTAITPEQFSGVFRRVGVRWSAAEQEDCPLETLREFQEELKQFFCAFILLNEGEVRRNELMRVVLDEQNGIEALVFSFVHEKDLPEFIATDGAMSDHGDWREVLNVLHYSFADEWRKFKMLVPQDYNGRHYNNFIHDVAAGIYATAVSEGVAKRQEVEKVDDLFTPLE